MSRCRVIAAGALLMGALVGCGADREQPETAATAPPSVPETAEAARTHVRAPDVPARPKPKPRFEARTVTSRPEPPTTLSTTSPAAPPVTQAETVPERGRSQVNAAPRKRKPKYQGAAPEQTIEQVASLHLVRREGLTFFQEGDVSGTLKGTMALEASLGGQGVKASFTVTLADGTLTGEGEARVKLGGDVVDFTGHASVTRGTGVYADVTGSGLRFSGTTAADGSTATIRLAGQLTS